MAVSPRDRDRMNAQVRALAAVERTDAPPPDAERRLVAQANDERRAAGREPLVEDPMPPETLLYERARALGLRRRRG